MKQINLQQINENAKRLVSGEIISEEDLNKLVDHVMNYMLTTGNTYLKAEHLDVDIDFIEAKVKSFCLCNAEGKKIDLRKYTGKFSEQLMKNQKNGIKKLSKDIFDEKATSQSSKFLIFGKN